MRLRDVGIIAVAIICCFIIWSQGSTVRFRQGFKISVNDYKTSRDMLPKPVLIEYKEDSKRFLLVATSESTLGLFEMTHFKFASGHLPPALLSTINISFDSPIIGFRGGFLEENAPIPIICVLTRDYVLRALNISNLEYRTIWKTRVIPTGKWRFGYSATISITSQRIHDDDLGMVTVAVKVVDEDGAILTRFAAFNGRNGEARWSFFSDGSTEANNVLHEANATTSAIPREDRDIFNISAIKGDTYTSIKHQPYHPSQRQGHIYEKPWTSFREAIIAALPHHYSHPWDVELKSHTIYPQKHTQRGSGPNPREKSIFKPSGDIGPGKDDNPGLGKKISSKGKKHAEKAYLSNSVPAKEACERYSHLTLPNTFVYHSKTGLEVLHMYTGSILTTIFPLKAYNSYYHDVNDDFHIESVSTQIGPRMVMYSDHGINIVNDCLGIIYTNIPSAEDEVFNATICDTEGFFGNLGFVQRFLNNAPGEGVPRVINTLELLGSKNIASQTISSVMPLVVEVQQSQSSGLLQRERYAVFMINTGLLTCVDPSRKRVRWRTQTSSSFVSTRKTQAQTYLCDFAEENYPKAFPHLAAYSSYEKNADDDGNYVASRGQLHSRTHPYILALGQNTLTAISAKTGAIICTLTLEEPPIAPVIVIDFNGDGVQDLVIVSRGNIYGFVGSAQVSSETLSALMMFMLVLLAFLLISRRIFQSNDEGEYSLPRFMHERFQNTKAFKRATD